MNYQSNMAKIILWNVITLDGCFEGEKQWDISFHELVWGAELEALSLEQLQEASMLIFGKTTYKGMANYWPTAKDEGQTAVLMNNLPKIVCSTSLEKAEWNNSTIIRDGVSQLKQLKEQNSKPMYIFGSGKLSQSLMNAGLIDEIRLCIAPIILGKGRRLFTDEYISRNLKLLESRSITNGVILRYGVDSNN